MGWRVPLWPSIIANQRGKSLYHTVEPTTRFIRWTMLCFAPNLHWCPAMGLEAPHPVLLEALLTEGDGSEGGKLFGAGGGASGESRPDMKVGLGGAAAAATATADVGDSADLPALRKETLMTGLASVVPDLCAALKAAAFASQATYFTSALMKAVEASRGLPQREFSEAVQKMIEYVKRQLVAMPEGIEAGPDPDPELEGWSEEDLLGLSCGVACSGLLCLQAFFTVRAAVLAYRHDRGLPEVEAAIKVATYIKIGGGELWGAVNGLDVAVPGLLTPVEADAVQRVNRASLGALCRC